ncbi:hypothetical protein [Armatimonas rosea]|uniref:Uncharacterized protein n=1 Tax=Armatimonas rosea TaxID=685828 RepID=A0A7W9SUL4_ARMRO|nr:hypothetical protein [Armatimonas rosea]MBB6053120.1 hypothetical protein [Armatimonas rosea]
MKLLFCGYCHDIVRLFPERRTCHCGRSWGQYLEDNSTTIQTANTLSLGIANPDFWRAVEVYQESPEHFSPELSMRAWINPLTEEDVRYIRPEDTSLENAKSL